MGFYKYYHLTQLGFEPGTFAVPRSKEQGHKMILPSLNNNSGKH